MQDHTRERTKKLWETDNYWLALLRDIIVAFLVVAAILSIVYLYSGSESPLVAVQSGSMVPHINIGDVVYNRGLNRVSVVTYNDGKATGYQRFGDYGDVIVYRPNGDKNMTPIIHRAMYFVKKGDPLPNNQGTAVHDGYITKGDHNHDFDQPLLYGGMPSVEPVKPEWIIGVAQQPAIPWIGNLRLALDTVISPLITIPQEYKIVSVSNLSDGFALSSMNTLRSAGTF
ncbi:MAG: S26 family signal peptidase [Halobacteriota archaeon]